MKKVLIQLFVAFFMVLSSPISIRASEMIMPNVGYQSSISDQWQDFSFGGALSGSENGDALTSIALHLVDSVNESSIEYRVYANGAWQAWSKDFEPTANAAFTGLQVRLVNYPNTEVHYQTYRKGQGWGSWVYNGQTSGNLSAPITGFRVKIFEVGVKYQSSINGDLSVVRHNGETLGTGKLDSLRMGLEQPLNNASLVYRVYFRSQGWSVWAKNWETLSSTNAIEAIEAKIEGNSNYHVAVQPYVKDSGWWDWVYDGATAGAIGSEITAYRVKLLRNAPTQVIEVEDDSPGIGDNPGTTTLTYSAGANAVQEDDEKRWFMGYSDLTVDGVFDDNPAGVSVEAGDQFTARLVSFNLGDQISVPNTFNGWGDNKVHNEQFEVYYGTYINGVFTVISTRYELENYVNDDYINIDEDLLTSETHTLILYDNDPVFLVYESENYSIISKSASEYPTSLVINGTTYNVSNDEGSPYIAGYIIFNHYETGINISEGGSTYIYTSGSNMIVDGFVLEGVYYEQAWYVDGEYDSRYMYYDLEYAINEDGYSINYR